MFRVGVLRNNWAVIAKCPSCTGTRGGRILWRRTLVSGVSERVLQRVYPRGPQKALTFVLRKYEAPVSSSCVPCVSYEIGMGAQDFESSRDV